MTNHIYKKGVLCSVLFLTVFLTSSYSAETIPAVVPPPPASDSLKVNPSEKDEAGTLSEKIDVQTMKRRYWTVGNEDLMSVVQNRLYTKKGKVETVLNAGFYSDDPFLSMNTIGVKVGYHLNETWSLHGHYSILRTKFSSAYEVAKIQSFTPVVNQPKNIKGAELRYSAIYGKLSLLSKSIMYYDFNIALGLSQITENTGSAMAPTLGFGQQIFLSKKLFITTEYRIMYHTQKYPVATLTYPSGDPNGSRSLWTNWIQIGIGTFL